MGVQIEEAGHGERHETPAAPDHVDDADPALGVPCHEVGHVERLAHARAERQPALLLREADEVREQQALDAVPDESPQHVEEQDPAADAEDRSTVDVVVGEEDGLALGQRDDDPQHRQRGVEEERAPKNPVGNSATLGEGLAVGRTGGGDRDFHGRRC